MGKALRVTSVMLTAAMILPLASCKKKTGSSSFTDSPTYVKEDDPYFNVETVELEMPIDPERELESGHVRTIRFAGDMVLYEYYVAYKTPRSGYFDLSDYETSVQELYDLSGNKICSLEKRPGEYQVAITADKDGNMYLLTAILGEDYYYHYEVDRLENGQWVKLFDLPEMDGNDSFSGSLQVAENGDYIITFDGSMGVYSKEGKKICPIVDPGRSVTPKIFHTGGKNYVITRSNTLEDDEDALLKEVDLKTGKLGPGRDATKLTSEGTVMASEDGIYVSSRSKVLKYDLEKDSLREVFDYNDTDIRMDLMYDAFCISKGENEYYAVYREQVSTSQTKAAIVHFTKADKNPHAGKKIITAAGEYLSVEFLNFVYAYNTDMTRGCRLRVKSYNEEMVLQGKDPEETNYEDYVRQEIKSGSAPDIILDFETCTSLFDDDLMVDLNPYMDGENGLDRSLYYDNVIRAFEKSGKLYFAPLGFCVHSLVANDAYVPEDPAWTYEGFLSCGSSVPENISFYETMLKTRILSMLYSTSQGEFVDYEKQKVSFDNPDFYMMLDIANRFGIDQYAEEDKTGVTYDEDGQKMIDGNSFFSEEDRFKEGMLATLNVYTTGVTAYGFSAELLKENLSFRGLPGKNAEGCFAECMLSMGIPTCSKNRNGAWEVIRAFYEDKAQEILSENYVLPLSKKAYRADAEKELENIRVEWKRLENAPEIVEFMHLPTAQDRYIDDLEQLILKVDRVCETDTAIENIMLEEAAAYFAGDRTKEDVAKNINNRAAIVVRER